MYAFLPCGHLDFESAVTKQSDEFKLTFDSSSSCSLNVKTWPRNAILCLDTYWYVGSMHLPQHKLCTRKTELALEVKFRLDVHWVYMATATNADQRKWRQLRNSAVSTLPRFLSPVTDWWLGIFICLQHRTARSVSWTAWPRDTGSSWDYCPRCRTGHLAWRIRSKSVSAGNAK